MKLRSDWYPAALRVTWWRDGRLARPVRPAGRGRPALHQQKR